MCPESTFFSQINDWHLYHHHIHDRNLQNRRPYCDDEAKLYFELMPFVLGLTGQKLSLGSHLTWEDDYYDDDGCDNCACCDNYDNGMMILMLYRVIVAIELCHSADLTHLKNTIYQSIISLLTTITCSTILKLKWFFSHFCKIPLLHRSWFCLTKKLSN